jgi:hypothetical protein
VDCVFELPGIAVKGGKTGRLPSINVRILASRHLVTDPFFGLTPVAEICHCTDSVKDWVTERLGFFGHSKMAFSRDSRMDRRRRALRDASFNELDESTSSGNAKSKQDSSESGSCKRSAGYSHNVRQACGVRLVQLIPVGWLSFSAAIVATIALTASLLAIHYLVYVNGKLDWYGHPLAIAFDATHPQGLAAWLGSQFWLLCLGSSLLTLQLRRFKLDDYKGEYRLWFWLVIACLAASIDSTTHLSELLGHSLNQWSETNVGWSGTAVVQTTLAVLVGMLGLRLCTELKAVPLSLVFWLVGLAAWAASAVLSHEIFRFDLTVQMRYWLRAALWLGGLAAIWISSLTYLRAVYMQAQRRFLARGRKSARSAIPLAEQFRKLAIPTKSPSSSNETPSPKEKTGRWSLAAILQSSFPEDEAEEYQKLSPKVKVQDETENQESLAQDRAAPNAERAALKAERAAEKAAERLARTNARQAARLARQESRKQRSGTAARMWLKPLAWLSVSRGWLKLPSLSGLKLNPPESTDDSSANASGGSPTLRAVSKDQPLPGTVRDPADSGSSLTDNRPLSKAERRRMRRQDRAA